LESFDDAQPFARNAPTPGTPPGARAQGGHPAIVIALLIPSHRALRAAKSGGDFSLRGVTGVDQKDPRIRLGHGVMDTVVMNWISSHHHDAVLALGAQSRAHVDENAIRGDRCR